MNLLKQLDKVTLVDMLSKYTSEYIKMLKAGDTNEEYHACKRKMTEIMAELESRRQVNANPTEASDS